MEFYIIDENYITYLRKFDSKVERTDYKGKVKPHIGILLTVDGVDFYVPISSPKQKHFAMSNAIDFHKIYSNKGELLAVVNLNNMLPAPKECVHRLFPNNLRTARSFDTEKTFTDYIYLLQREGNILDSLSDKLSEKAGRLYEKYKLYPDARFAERCCNFPMLIEKSIEYQKKDDEVLFIGDDLDKEKLKQVAEANGSHFLMISNEPDMSRYYMSLINHFVGREEACPLLEIVNGLGRNHIWTTEDILLLEKGGSLEEALASTEKEEADVPLGIKTPDIYDLYLLAVSVCQDLKIPCPQIFVTDDKRLLPNTRGTLFENGLKNGFSNMFISPMSLEASVACIAHELRHIWQHSKHEEKYFSDYMHPDNIIDEESLIRYRLQPAEIDAEAFSVRCCIQYGIEKFPVRRYEHEQINTAVEERARNMILPSKYSY